jgi:MscS family membrane protein
MAIPAILEMTFFNNTLLQYFIFFSILSGAIIVGKIAYYLIKNFIKVLTKKTETVADDMLIEVCEHPAIFLIFIIGFYIAYKTLTLTEAVEHTFFNIVLVMIIFNLTWFFTRLIDGLIKYYLVPFSQKTQTDLDDALIPILRRLSKIILIFIAAIIVLDKFGYNVASLVAGLGIGGLAVALAAQETLSNVFGGITILTDRPFTLGDRIKVSGNDGFVKEIGMRSTKITTLDGSELVVPNATIAKEVIENVTRERERRIRTVIGVVYETPTKKLEKFREIVKKIISEQEGVVNGKCDVLFDEYADSSLNFVVVYWITELLKIPDIKSEVNFKIKEACEKEGIEFAYPTRVIYNKKC